MMVRTAVLKGKDPLKLLQEMEIIDQMGVLIWKTHLVLVICSDSF